jgi:hypothetical protein
MSIVPPSIETSFLPISLSNEARMSLGAAEFPLLDIAAIAAAATKDLVAKRTRTPTHTLWRKA